MTRKQLIKAIHDSKDNWSCPDSGHCDLPEKEKNAGDCCMKCAEKQLAEYEEKIIIDFLTFCREHADEYDDNGWSLADLIELNIRFQEAKKNVKKRN